MTTRIQEIFDFIIRKKSVNIRDLDSKFNETEDKDIIKDVVLTIANCGYIRDLEKIKFCVNIDVLKRIVDLADIISFETIDTVINEYDDDISYLLINLDNAILTIALDDKKTKISIDELKKDTLIDLCYKVNDEEQTKTYDPIKERFIELYVAKAIEPKRKLMLSNDISYDIFQKELTRRIEINKVKHSIGSKVISEIFLSSKNSFNIAELQEKFKFRFSTAQSILNDLELADHITYIDGFNFALKRNNEILDEASTKVKYSKAALKASIKYLANKAFRCSALNDSVYKLYADDNTLFLEINDDEIALSNKIELDRLNDVADDAEEDFLYGLYSRRWNNTKKSNKDGLRIVINSPVEFMDAIFRLINDTKYDDDLD